MKKENILITGGAGYIGSHNAKMLKSLGITPIIYDNLSEGHLYAAKWGPFIEGDINDVDKLDFTIKKYNIKAAMHFAANALVYESEINPQKYYHNNVIGTLNLLEALLKNNVKKLIFSSTCATYGIPKEMPLLEDHDQSPISTYGQTKYMIEKILEDYDRAYNLKFISLRYFNAAGADLDAEIGEDHKTETHLIPLAIETALNFKDSLDVFGTDYETKDGTAVRDYIHVNDLASAHIKALKYLFENKKSHFLNLGSENGFSILEVLSEIENQLDLKINKKFSNRRQGDPPILFANSKKAKNLLNWDTKYSDLKTIISSAIKWHKVKPR
ncbi:MAG: UDP-glucose 4-epimerase GalE [Parachlamydiales bacterium]|nr:UDP-glucose 4-epimerase GalE [Parachlamydiales bacterium]